VAERLTEVDVGRPTLTILRSGCYITQDHLHYAAAFERLRTRLPPGTTFGPGLVPALEVWGCVQSRPEPARAYVTGGKRDLSHDMHLPTPVAGIGRDCTTHRNRCRQGTTPWQSTISTRI